MNCKRLELVSLSYMDLNESALAGDAGGQQITSILQCHSLAQSVLRCTLIFESDLRSSASP